MTIVTIRVTWHKSRVMELRSGDYFACCDCLYRGPRRGTVAEAEEDHEIHRSIEMRRFKALVARDKRELDVLDPIVHQALPSWKVWIGDVEREVSMQRVRWLLPTSGVPEDGAR